MIHDRWDYWVLLVEYYSHQSARTMFLGDFYAKLKQVWKVRLYASGGDPEALSNEKKVLDDVWTTPKQTPEERKQFESMLAGMFGLKPGK